MAKILVVANWKMNPQTWREAKKLFEATRKMTGKMKNISVVLAPPAIYLRPLAKDMRGNRIAFAVQNAHWEPSGAHTGELSMRQAKDAGASYVLVGHAERREMGETNEETREKVAASLKENLTPIFCVGEKARTSDAAYLETVAQQLRIGLADVTSAKVSRVIIAYEPLWAIGAEHAMRPHDMHEMTIFIRKTIVDAHGPVGHKVKILYGGSVDEKNADAMLQGGDVHGLLVGRASIDLRGFAEILRAMGV
ncbi:triose-phosphate isomerase [Candidatus Kaiserbacteria bacterium RIFCSPHIGHO2_01_FULL_56_24]|uniref:Triosephosphate isomerase n=1 Tax=Candidatus Kaiserbacteria bacterium RIFCSPHIGHO2_01_FULL_56_24 TaxID=1798487 RepID=A0A1F6D8T2_9BACT|nr:MAG: triose-phosphate isomerase [Candidatus Kaiserbacteria bacterium RIFCSPHIGHO2_01_FULL_56_24]